MCWIGLVQARDQLRALLNAVMHLLDLQDSRKFLSGCSTGGLLSSAQLHTLRKQVGRKR
jgi:poly(3-hydroxybutyrate) depolymerase